MRIRANRPSGESLFPKFGPEAATQFLPSQESSDENSAPRRCLLAQKLQCEEQDIATAREPMIYQTASVVAAGFAAAHKPREVVVPCRALFALILKDRKTASIRMGFILSAGEEEGYSHAAPGKFSTTLIAL